MASKKTNKKKVPLTRVKVFSSDARETGLDLWLKKNNDAIQDGDIVLGEYRYHPGEIVVPYTDENFPLEPTQLPA